MSTVALLLLPFDEAVLTFNYIINSQLVTNNNNAEFLLSATCYQSKKRDSKRYTTSYLASRLCCYCFIVVGTNITTLIIGHASTMCGIGVMVACECEFVNSRQLHLCSLCVCTK